MIECKETEEGFQITWDSNDPVESVFNTWTEQDFIDAIMAACNRVIEEHEKNKEQSEN
jgi:hypothetical protein